MARNARRLLIARSSERQRRSSAVDVSPRGQGQGDCRTLSVADIRTVASPISALSPSGWRAPETQATGKRCTSALH